MTWHELKFLNFYNNIVSQEHVYIIDHGEASNPRSVETNVACFFFVVWSLLVYFSCQESTRHQKLVQFGKLSFFLKHKKYAFQT